MKGRYSSIGQSVNRENWICPSFYSKFENSKSKFETKTNVQPSNPLQETRNSQHQILSLTAMPQSSRGFLLRHSFHRCPRRRHHGLDAPLARRPGRAQAQEKGGKWTAERRKKVGKNRDVAFYEEVPYYAIRLHDVDQPPTIEVDYKGKDFVKH